MPAPIATGYLVLVDLTGYTAYLSGSELEYAPIIAGDLPETVVGRLEPPFRLAKLEGDAAFLFAEDGRADGSLLLDALEAAYVAFRRRLRSIDAATTCDCNSCLLAPRLGLKLFAHHGSYVQSRIAGRDELAGPDVILVHRLLKGEVAMAARAGGFAQLTGGAATALGIDPPRLGMTPAVEPVEHLGSVPTFVWDLEARWRAESAVRRLDGAGGAAVVDASTTLDADPPTVWAHLTAPALRSRWEGLIVAEEASVAGRRGVGTVTQCVTGRLATTEEIVDWQPYDHVGWRVAVPGVGPVDAAADLEPDGGATRLRLRWTVDPARGGDRSAWAAIAADKRAALERLARLLATSDTSREGSS